jgi:hypothetical protein
MGASRWLDAKATAGTSSVIAIAHTTADLSFLIAITSHFWNWQTRGEFRVDRVKSLTGVDPYLTYEATLESDFRMREFICFVALRDWQKEEEYLA